MKNGLFTENGERVFYKNDRPSHAGVIEIDGDLYYAGRNGRIVTGQYIVHREMCNGLLEHGTYTFDGSGKLVPGSYIAPKRKHSSHHKHKRTTKKRKRLPLRKQWVFIPVAILMIAALFIGAFHLEGVWHQHDEREDEPSVPTITLPTFEAPISLCSPAAEKLYRHECTMEQLQKGDPYRPLEFSYKLAESDGLLTLSEHADLSDAARYVLPHDELKITIDNLKTGTVYYYCVDVDGETYTGRFETAAGTRFLSIPGVYNTRDIGGYTTADGKTVTQGLLIRGTEIDGLADASFFLAAEDVAPVMAQFRFVCDMDLRSDTVFSKEYTSRFGKEVTHQFYKAPMYGGIFNAEYKEALKTIFSDLAKAENYPMYMHCTYGADRTGTIVYLLQGLLNMSEADMLREYQMTGFFSSDVVASTQIEVIKAGLATYEGDTLQEKIRTFMVEYVGVTEEEITSIRQILLEEPS